MCNRRNNIGGEVRVMNLIQHRIVRDGQTGFHCNSGKRERISAPKTFAACWQPTKLQHLRLEKIFSARFEERGSFTRLQTANKSWLQPQTAQSMRATLYSVLPKVFPGLFPFLTENATRCKLSAAAKTNGTANKVGPKHY